MVGNYAFESWLTSSPTANGVGPGELEVMVWLVDKYRDYPWDENVLNFTIYITEDDQLRRAMWRAFVVCKIMDGWTYIAFRPVEDLANASIVFPYTPFIEKAAEITVTHCGLNAEKR